MLVVFVGKAADGEGASSWVEIAIEGLFVECELDESLSGVGDCGDLVDEPFKGEDYLDCVSRYQSER